MDLAHRVRALWGACEETARSRGGKCRLVGEKVASLHALEEVHGHYTAVIVAAGAAAGTLPEIGALQPNLLCTALLERMTAISANLGTLHCSSLRHSQHECELIAERGLLGLDRGQAPYGSMPRIHAGPRTSAL